MRIPSTAATAAIFCLTLTGCTETTGDPRRGGYFGWSRAESDGRMAAMHGAGRRERTALAATRGQGEAERLRQQRLEDEGRSLGGEIQNQESARAQLRQEEAELARAEEKLERTIAERDRVNTEVAGSEDERAARLKQLTGRISDLRTEVSQRRENVRRLGRME
jgi:chromosome segregation ATPase